MDKIPSISAIKLSDFRDPDKYESFETYFKFGTSEAVTNKLSSLRIHLHDLLTEEIARSFKFQHCHDVDVGLFDPELGDLTPDLFDPETFRWGEVTISWDKLTASENKLSKYRKLIKDQWCLDVFVYDVTQGRLYLYRSGFEDGTFMTIVETPWIENEILLSLNTALSFYESARKYETILEKKPPHPKILEQTLCSEAQKFAENDGGVLLDLIENNSFDSSMRSRSDFKLKRDRKLKDFAIEIAQKARGFESSFKPTDTEELKKAFEFAETSINDKTKYNITEKPKPSCHGIPGIIAKVPKAVDTRDFVVQKFKTHLQESRSGFCRELLASILYHENETIPKNKIEKMKLEAELRKMSPRHNDFPAKSKKLQSLTQKQKWDRNSLKVPKQGLIEKTMRIGKIDTRYDDKVTTVPFWDPEFANVLKNEIKEKTCSFIAEENCWTPHKEYKPRTKEAGRVYNLFLQTRLYQEIAQVGQLASNILRMSTKPRKNCSLTTSLNSNMMAIIGPGDGAMNEGSTIPLIWMAFTDDESCIWMPSKVVDGNMRISDGDRLTKNRLEQMVDAPRLASIAAAICCVDLTGSDRALLYACGVMATIAMSINIRDSELIDHIRYMVPNIFSERSCSSEYIREKYNAPLKTRLQCLIYTETKKTLLQSAQIVKEYHEVEIENDEVVSGGVTMKIPFLDCHADSVFKLNGIVYTGFFSCRKGLHNPRVENKKMFGKICEYEFKSFGKDIIEASFNPSSYHYFNPEYVAYTMSDLVETYANLSSWRAKMSEMDNLKKPFQLQTFSSLRSSLKGVETMDKIRLMGSKSKLRSSKKLERGEEISQCWNTLWSDARTRVVDHFFDVNETILEQGIEILRTCPSASFYATWDQKRQRTGRDREVFILNPEGKVLMHNVESLFKIVCEGIPHELITLPGNKKIVSMCVKGTQYFKKIKELKREEIKYENLRMTEDMTKWAPGDNVCKFIYAIAALPFLEKQEKICYINFLCTSLRKKVVLNAVATEAVGSMISDKHVFADEVWSQMLGVSEKDETGLCLKFKRNYVEVRFNWLMGVLNDTSSAVHAACAHMLKKVIEVDYKVHHYEPDVHSDDASVDIIVSKKLNSLVTRPLLDYFPSVTMVNLNYACIKLSDKKSYVDRYRKEFVSEVDDNGILKSYWQKQAIAAISGLSYIDFFRDISEGCSKISNLISLGGPPTVYEVAMSNIVDMARETYSMAPGMWNDPARFLDVDKKKLPLELGGEFQMNPILLPIVGLKYQTFSKMVDQILDTVGKETIGELTEEDEAKLSNIEGNLFTKVWIHTTEIAVKEDLVLNRLDPGMIRFKQFASYDKVKTLRLMKVLENYDEDLAEAYIEHDPTIVLRQAESIEEQNLKLSMLIKNPSWFSSATLQSQGALKLDRMFNVKSPCCAPVRSFEKDQPMQRGMKTIREAIADGLMELKKRRVTLNETLKLVKSMPLLCYVHEIERKAKFRKGRMKMLYPVQKQAFMKESLIHSSVTGLLQYYYTKTTNFSIDRHHLDEEIELVKLYCSQLTDLDKAQQAVAIYRIFQQTMNFSSVLFVPSIRMRGHQSILGVMCNQFSDFHNWYPSVHFPPPENQIYKTLQKKKELTLAAKCSQIATFLMKLTNNEQHARTVFNDLIFEDKPMTEILDSFKPNDRQAMYAFALSGSVDKIRLPQPNEVVWIIPQKRSYLRWVGPFAAYMNVGTKQKKKGLFIFGEDTFIQKISITGLAEDYPNLKQNFQTFANSMDWSDNITKHLTLVQDKNQWVVTFPQYGSSFQALIRQGALGVPITKINGPLVEPEISYDAITPEGLELIVEYRGTFNRSRFLNQRLTNDFFDFDTESHLGPFLFSDCWKRLWHPLSHRSPINIDHFQIPSDLNHLFLENNVVQKLAELGVRFSSMIDPSFTAQQMMGLEPMPLSGLFDMRNFKEGSKWTQGSYNFYMSLAIRSDSKLKTWVSLKGFLQNLHKKFVLIDTETIKKFMTTVGSPFNKKEDMIVESILRFGDDVLLFNLQPKIDYESMLTQEIAWEPIKTRWSDLPSDSDSDGVF